MFSDGYRWAVGYNKHAVDWTQAGMPKREKKGRRDGKAAQRQDYGERRVQIGMKDRDSAAKRSSS